MALKFLQANINHSARAQDLLIQSMAEWLISIAVISEPYFVSPSLNWIADEDELVAIVSRSADGSPPFTNIVKGRGYVAGLLGGIVVVGAYFSPNRVLAEFETFLVEMGALVGRSHPNSVLVLGDFNAKSTAWGSPATDVRGEVLEEWAVLSGLSILNRGSVNTCVRQQGESMVDLSFASPELVRRVQGWKVMADVETLSDHRYIRFDVSTLPTVPNSPTRSATTQMGNVRWALSHLDRDALEEASLVQAWISVVSGPDDINVNQEAEWFRGAMTHICDASMPRVRPYTPKRQVYWWSAEIAQLRRACVVTRRQYTRQRRRRFRDEDLEVRLYAAYKEAKETLQLAIARAKTQARDELLETLNRDPWGRPYRSVRGKLRPWAPPLTQSLEPRLLEEVIPALFPTREEHTPPTMAPPASDVRDADTDVPEVTDIEMRMAVLRLQSKKTAPGPDGIPGRAWVLALRSGLGQRLCELFEACLQQGRFPGPWKTGRLVLLRKEGRPADSPSAYRPIVLLDEVGKLFERIIAGRLLGHLNSAGPNLNDNQFGFRRGRSTVGAILRVKALAEEAVSRGDVVLAVSLDISNAFNTLPWSCIMEALRYHQMPHYLCKIVSDYFVDRFVVYQGQNRWCQRKMSCGVPQGSVLGPLLWNIGYDWVLRGDTLPGIRMTCYADDTLVTASGRNFRDAGILATAGVAQVVSRIRQLGLEVALNKTEALCFHGPRKAPPAGSHIIVGGTQISVESTMKYLGLVLDSRWKFNSHFQRLAPKLMGVAAALGGLIPNLRGANAGCRRLYMGVVRSMALYGAPVWAEALNRQNVALLRKPQRVMTIRLIRGYRTISFEAACVLAGSPPWDLDADLLAAVHFWREDALVRGERPAPREVESHRNELQENLLREWQERLALPSAGVRTIEAVRPVLQQWMGREHGTVTFRMAQVLSGHGCFGKYLCRIGREQFSLCHHCDGCSEDTAQHTLEFCPAWAEERRDLNTKVGQDLSLSNLIRAMVDSDNVWKAVLAFCEAVMTKKESAERERETENPIQIRRRRTGRRRRAYADLHPP